MAGLATLVAGHLTCAVCIGIASVATVAIATASIALAIAFVCLVAGLATLVA